MLESQTGPGGTGILTTAGGDGVPHATWMGTVVAPRWDQLATITSPDSRKVANIRANPNVEWLFSSTNRAELVYLEGQAEVVTEPREIKRYWKALPDKGRAFFLLYFNSGLGFCVLRTRIEQAVLCLPAEYR
ncbi:MAG: pyridoxamine 5'-phosphate oxidase family protein, partial [Planctomycetota bacterium]